MGLEIRLNCLILVILLVWVTRLSVITSQVEDLVLGDYAAPLLSLEIAFAEGTLWIDNWVVVDV